MAGSDEITKTLLAEHADTVALVGFLDVRDDNAVISADSRFTHAMTFRVEDIVAKETVSVQHEAVPEVGKRARPDRYVILIAGKVMRSPILEQQQREQLAASFLTGPIGEGAEVLIPGTLEGAAWRLGIAHSVQCDDPKCSIRWKSPYC